MNKRRFLTKKAMITTTVRLSQGLVDLTRRAAENQGESQSEFLRVALRERAIRVLRQHSNTETGNASKRSSRRGQSGDDDE
jgi:uncharacterized protein (DUF1778 family)